MCNMQESQNPIQHKALCLVMGDQRMVDEFIAEVMKPLNNKIDRMRELRSEFIAEVEPYGNFKACG